ncbi:MAG: hypothetical protein IPF97_06090 [Sphingomonadales bacterium]|nr:hypothetical protein [Sphingomonadales bacterium]
MRWGVQGTQGADRIERKVYDGASQVVALERGVGTALAQAYARYGFSANGKTISVTDANGISQALVTMDMIAKIAGLFRPKPRPARSIRLIMKPMAMIRVATEIQLSQT